MFDVIIAGASFSGLAVASELEGNILLIDKKEIGSEQKSACSTFYRVFKELKCEKSVLQEFTKAVLHCPKEMEIDLIERLCTFDYKIFCKILAKRVRVKKLKAVVMGVKGNTVITDSGKFQSECIVDCTGWQAILASFLRKDFVDKNKLSFGIETVVDYQDDKLHYFFDTRIIKQGVAWIFPIGKKSRIGIATYVGRTNLLPELKRFLDSMDLKIGAIHGGYIPYGLRKPVVSNVFLVGDSAGQTPPLTAEGIRKSIYFGRQCGKIIQKIINKEIILKEGLKEYRNFVEKNKTAYSYLLSLQNQLVENRIPDILMEMINNKYISKILQKKYLNL